MLIITSKKEGFRCCGVAHPATPTEHADDRFNEKELAALRAEPMLMVLNADEAKAELINKQIPAADKIAFLSKIEILEELEKVAEGETRKTVLEAIKARRKELEA